MTALLEARDVAVALGGRTIVSGAALAAEEGTFLAVIGPNGAGKTTLLRAVAGLVPATGDIRLGGTPLRDLSRRERARRLAYLPQGHVFHWPLAVAEIVALGRLPRGGGGGPSEADRAAVARAMAETGTDGFAARAVTTLSGGERARVALARVLATGAATILADEPTASLDPHYQLVVLDILKRHAAAGGAVVAVLHDLGLAGRYADRVVLMDGGRTVAAGPPAEVLTEQRLSEAFGVRIEIVERHGVRVVIPWEVVPGRQGRAGA